MRGAFLLSMTVAPQQVWADCSSPIIDSVLSLFNVSNIEDVPGAVVEDLKERCLHGNCPHVTLPGCGAQSLDEMVCELPVFDVPIKLGTDTICNTACDDWPCKVGCQGIDTGICHTEDFVLCKTGCLVGGIFDHKCLQQCEHIFVDPCVKILVDDCNAACEATFNTCHAGCEKELTMQLTGYFEKMEHMITSLAISKFELDCHGNALTKPLVFDTNVSAGIDDLGLSLKIHTKDVSIGTTTTIDLEQLKVQLSLPVNGSVQCGLFKKNIDIQVGDASVDDFDLNIDINQKALHAVASIICLDLPFCKDAISDAIDGAIRLVIKETVPVVMAKVLSPAIQAVVDLVECPAVVEPDEALISV